MSGAESSIELSIVLPCLNEAQTLPICLRKARSFLERYRIDGEIIVADNGSQDDSANIAHEMGARVIHVGEKGYGAALSGGIAAARGKYVIMADADDSYDLADPISVLDELKKGYELVVGNRFQGGIHKGAMPWLNRYIGNPVLSMLGRLFFKIPVRDFHCGLRGFLRESIVKLDLRTTGMEFASEMIVRAALYNLKMTEVPTPLYPDGRSRKPHLRPWRDGWRHLRFLLLYSPRWLYLYPGIAMIVLGAIISGFLLPGPLLLPDNIKIDVHTLLISAMTTLAGIQAITFGLLAKAYAVKNGLLPPKVKRDNPLTTVTMERLLVGGVVFVAVGFICLAVAFHIWSDERFGILIYSDVMRLVIIGVTCAIGGLHLAFIGFIFGVMNIQHKI